MTERRGYDEEPGELLHMLSSRQLIIGGAVAAIAALMPLKYLAEGSSPGHTVIPVYGVVIAWCVLLAMIGITCVVLGVTKAHRMRRRKRAAKASQPQSDSAIQ